MELDIQLLFQSKGFCHFKDSVPFIAYNKHNWSEIAAFCAPFTIQRTKKGKDHGRAIVDLPTGNESFEYGMILVRLGKRRILLMQPTEFEEIFTLDPVEKKKGFTIRQRTDE
ncbi:hypothetical protein IGI39_004787 [Enterococcus sp. AZ135]|uniref:hypothetical protein n=1 Tax=unclassified Enterococcus TaxID=2608891 RepID=UPI003F237B05